MRSQVTRDWRCEVLTQKRNREYFGEMELFSMSNRTVVPQPTHLSKLIKQYTHERQSLLQRDHTSANLLSKQKRIDHRMC